jgi:hypothetical protein
MNSSPLIGATLVLALGWWPSNVPPVPAAEGGQATQVRVDGRSALLSIDEGDRYAFLTVIRDEIADATSLSFAYRFPDPTEPNWYVLVIGDEGQIPNSAFTLTAGSAHLALTTPDSYVVTRCRVNDETGEFTCAPAGPSTLDLTWTADGYRTFREILTQVAVVGPTSTRVHGRLEEVSASVTGTWDGRSATDATGFLTDSENATLFREATIAANLRRIGLPSLRPEAEASHVQRSRTNGRDAFSFLDGDGLNGFVSVLRDEIANTTLLTFGYAFPYPGDPSATLVFQGQDEIPDDGFTINSSTARLRVTTPDSFFVHRCVVTGVVGGGGTVTCVRASSPVTFDLTWNADGSGTLHETATTVETIGPMTTQSHRQINQLTAVAAGTWIDDDAHSGTLMTGRLTNFQNATIDKSRELLQAQGDSALRTAFERGLAEQAIGVEYIALYSARRCRHCHVTIRTGRRR